MRQDYEKEMKDLRRKQNRPIKIFIGIVVLATVFGGIWIYNQYKIRKAVEAADAQYIYAESQAQEAQSEAMNQQLKDAGFTQDENGVVSIEGMDMDFFNQMLESVHSEAGDITSPDGVPNIECSKSDNGTEIYTVNGIVTTERPELFGSKELVYNGVTYKRNTAVKAWLILGVDNVGSLQEDRDISEIGLSDGIFLVAEDTAKNKIHIIQVPRDTMTEITVTDDNSDPVGTKIDHLTRAWMYGDNHEKSGKYAMEAVSKVFGGLPINGYMAGSIDIINELNNYIGGVEVTINEDGLEVADPAFVKGATVLLQGKQAETFVRKRDTSADFTAMSRMSRHRQYAIAFENKVIEMQKKDSDIIPGMFSLIENNIITDMSKGTYLKIAMDAVLKDKPLSEEDFSTFEGENVVNHEEKLDEFWPDYTQVDQLTLDTFFRADK